jgi:hypothetical protein
VGVCVCVCVCVSWHLQVLHGAKYCRYCVQQNTFCTVHILYSTHSMQYTFYVEHILYSTHSMQSTFYTEHKYCVKQNTFYTVHILYRTHFIQNMFYTVHILYRTHSVQCRPCLKHWCHSPHVAVSHASAAMLMPRPVGVFFLSPSSLGAPEPDCK